MKRHVTQDLARILMIIAQLRASVIVRVGYDCIYIPQLGFRAKHFRQPVNRSVHTTDSRDNPNLIADADFSVRPPVPLERQMPVGNIQLHVYGFILVVEYAIQIGLYRFLVHPIPLPDFFPCMSDGIAVFYDIPSGRNISQCKFMPGRDIRLQYNICITYRYIIALLQIGYRYGHIIRRIYFHVFHPSVL